jgi:LAO/AO transport system kinase
VGQIELDIAEAADTTIVMIVPEGGDIIQGMKSGLMEIGDLFAINKADRPGAERMQRDLEYVLHLKEKRSDWNPAVLLAVAVKNEGVSEIWQEIEKHRQFLLKSEQLHVKRRARIKKRLEILVRDQIQKAFWNEKRKKTLQNYLLNDAQTVSPYKVAQNLLSEILNDK